MKSAKYIVLLVLVIHCAAAMALAQASAPTPASPEPRVITPAPGNPYQPLTGPPATERTRLGYVVLEPGKSIGRHSTNENEEFVVVLEGSGVFAVENGPSLQMAPNSVVYCPPNRFHNVTNTGKVPLRYFFIVPRTN